MPLTPNFSWTLNSSLLVLVSVPRKRESGCADKGKIYKPSGRRCSFLHFILTAVSIASFGEGLESSSERLRAFPYPRHLQNTLFLGRVKFNLISSSYRYKAHAGWMELRGRQEMLPAHHTKDTGPHGQGKVMESLPCQKLSSFFFFRS